MVFQHLLFGLIAVAVGVVSLKYNWQLAGFTGTIQPVERYLGAGTTYIFLKMLSVILCIGGFMYMFGLFNPVFGWLLSPLAHFFHPGGSSS
jgi:hypothetical protein